VVNSRGVQIGDDNLQIDEFHYVIAESDIDFRELLTGPDIALALIELAADPDDESLRKRAVGRLAIAHGWFQNRPNLEVSAARITGRGIGRLLGGVFIWRAHDEHDTFTYIVTPTLRARDLLKADPGLARALIQVACPRPDVAHGELERWLAVAIARLGAAVSPGAVRQATPGGSETAAVLEVKSTGGAVSVPEAAGRSDSERALSEELAELARKVGTAAVRSAAADGAERAPRPA
jgi:hypothetical protein